MTLFIRIFFVVLVLIPSTGAIATRSDTLVIGASALLEGTQCMVTVGPTTINYGSLSRWQLQKSGVAQHLTPGKRTLILTVTCPFNQEIRLSMEGNAAPNGQLRYGEEGYATVRLSEVMADGHEAMVALIEGDGNVVDTSETSLFIKPGSRWEVVNARGKVRARSVTARLEVEPIIPDWAAKVSGEQVSESALTLSVDDTCHKKC
jgi:hypothetical protein